MSVPSSAPLPRQPQVWGYPTNQSPDAIILNESLRQQLLTILPTNKSIRVHLLRDVGYGGITMKISTRHIEAIILGPRDGE